MHFSTQRLVCACAILPVGLFTAGCSNNGSLSLLSAPASAAGNWSFAAPAGSSLITAGLIDVNGEITGSATVTGCAGGPQQTIVQGMVDSAGNLRFGTGRLTDGSVLQLQGRLSSDGKSVEDAALFSSGSSCGALTAGRLKGQVYAPDTGSYTGTFIGSDQAQTPVAATLSQNSDPGAGGGYALSGSISFPASPCLGTGTATIVNGSTVTGSTLNAVYATTVSGQSVTITAVGTADPDATMLNITNWTISGGVCDGYSGTGQLTD